MEPAADRAPRPSVQRLVRSFNSAHVSQHSRSVIAQDTLRSCIVGTLDRVGAQKLSLHSHKRLLVGLCYQVPEARMSFKLGRHVGVFGYLDNLAVEHVRAVLRPSDPDEGALPVGTA